MISIVIIVLFLFFGSAFLMNAEDILESKLQLSAWIVAFLALIVLFFCT